MTETKRKLLSFNIFMNNEYLDKYVELCANHVQPDCNNYYEAHHIIPRCVFHYFGLDVDNSERNIVNLTSKNHLMAHYFLCLCIENQDVKEKLVFALLMMLNTRTFPNYESLLEMLDRYEELKICAAERRRIAMMGNQFAKGNILTEETKLQMSKSRMGHTTSDVTKQKLIQSATGRKCINKDGIYKQVPYDELDKYLVDGWSLGGHAISEVQKQQISSKNTGAKRTKEAKEKMSQAKLGKSTWNKGIAQSAQTKQKNQKAHIGRKWFTNGVNEIFIKDISKIPDGYIPGRIKKRKGGDSHE